MYAKGTAVTQITDENAEWRIFLLHHRQSGCAAGTDGRETNLRSALERGSAMIVSSKAMEEYARECVRFAQLANKPELREQLLQMAREWMAAAMGETEAHEGQDRHH